MLTTWLTPLPSWVANLGALVGLAVAAITLLTMVGAILALGRWRAVADAATKQIDFLQGWEEEARALKLEVSGLRAEAASLREEVAELRAKVASDATELQTMRAERSTMRRTIQALTTRVGVLEALLRANGIEVPPPATPLATYRPTPRHPR